MVKDFFADPNYVRESHHEYISALPLTEEDKKSSWKFDYEIEEKVFWFVWIFVS